MQVVLAQRMSIDFDSDPINVYRALRYLNPSPYMVFFDMDDHHVVSASPEILARVENGKITFLIKKHHNEVYCGTSENKNLRFY